MGLLQLVQMMCVSMLMVHQTSSQCSLVPDCQTCYQEAREGKDVKGSPWVFLCPKTGARAGGALCHDFHLHDPVSFLDLRHYYFKDSNLCSSLEKTLRVCHFPTTPIKAVDFSYSRFLYSCTAELVGFLYSVADSIELLRLRSIHFPRRVLPLDLSGITHIRFKKLKELDLSWNGYTEKSVANGLGSHIWDSLEVLNFDNNNVTQIPSQFSLMPLKHLSIANNDIRISMVSTYANSTERTIDSFKFLSPKLETLDLSGNTINEFPSVLTEFQVLKTLRMSGVRLSRRIDLPSANGFQKLEVLDISGNILTRTSLGTFLANLRELRILKVNKNFFERWPIGLDRLKLLQSLYMQDNQLFSLAPFALQNCSRLKYLDVSNNNILTITEPSFYGIENSLQYLFLHNNNIRTLNKRTFKRVRALRRLTLSGNPFHCDCSLAWIRNLSTAKNFVISDIGSAMCHSPTSFKWMTIEEFPTDGCSKDDLTFNGSTHDADSTNPSGETTWGFEDPWHITVIIAIALTVADSIFVLLIFIWNRKKRSVASIVSGTNDDVVVSNPYETLRRTSKVEQPLPGLGYKGLEWDVGESVPKQPTTPRPTRVQITPSEAVRFHKGLGFDEYEDPVTGSHPQLPIRGAAGNAPERGIFRANMTGNCENVNGNSKGISEAPNAPYLSFEDTDNQRNMYYNGDEAGGYYNTGKKKAFIQPIIYDSGKESMNE